MFRVFALFALLSSLSWMPIQAAEPGLQPSPGRRQALIHMVIQDCGSCHGLTLKGGLGPALLPADLADKDVPGLVATIHQGRPGTAMPPFKSLLNEAEAAWIVEQLRQGFPRDQGERP